MQTHVLRTSLRDEVKLADPGASESRGVRGWTAVEVPDKFWIHARRTDIGADGNLQVRQWVTADFHEAVRFSRGDGVISFSMFVGVFAPAAAASGVIFGEVSEVLHSAPSGTFSVRYGNGLSLVLHRGDATETPRLESFETLYRADARRPS